MTVRVPLVLDTSTRLPMELSSSDNINIDNSLTQGYIEGLKMVWVSANALTVTTGAAYIPSSGSLLRVGTDIAKTSLSLTASTWYHVYLFNNAGTPDIEIVTTAPAAPYNGTARAKTGDTTRRYIGSIRATATNTMLKFIHSPQRGAIKYLVDINNVDLFILNNGTSSTAANVSAASAVPVTSQVMWAFAENNTTTGLGIVFISNSDAGASPSSNILEFIRTSRTVYGEFALTSTQTFSYQVSSTATAFVYCNGYNYDR